MTQQSLWKATSQSPTFSSLTADITVDTLIIGGGITGVTTAYLLKQAGQSVHLVEAGAIGSGDTGLTTAHLSTSSDLQYQQILQSHDAETVRTVATAMREAVDRIHAIAEAEGIDCDFAYEPAYLYAEHTENRDALEKEYDAVRETELKAEWVDKNPLPFPVDKTLRFARNARFHPLKFVYGLAQKVQLMGVPIYTMTRIVEMSKEDDQRVFKTDAGHTIRARRVVMATHLPGFSKPEQSALVPSRTYAMAYKVNGEVPRGLFWDMQEPYHYTRQATYQGEEVLITGGADHRTGEVRETETRFDALERYIRAHFPVQEIVHRWSGQWYEPTDQLPLIGQSMLHDDVYLSSGYSGDGMVWGVAGAGILADLLAGRENGFSETFRPRRFPVQADYLKNNAAVAKHLIGDRLPFGASKVADIQAGEGRIVQEGLSKYAVYRDEAGELTALSAVCTHMYCIVEWNGTEKTWDCACHGGQFSAHGEPLRAPVTLPLEKHAIEDVMTQKEES